MKSNNFISDELLQENFSSTVSFLLRWLTVILRRDNYRIEESMKFGTKTLVGVKK